MAKYSIPEVYSRMGYKVIRSEKQAYQLLRRYLKTQYKIWQHNFSKGRKGSGYPGDPLLFSPGNYYCYLDWRQKPKGRTEKREKLIRRLFVVEGKQNAQE